MDSDMNKEHIYEVVKDSEKFYSNVHAPSFLEITFKDWLEGYMTICTPRWGGLPPYELNTLIDNAWEDFVRMYNAGSKFGDGISK